MNWHRLVWLGLMAVLSGMISTVSAADAPSGLPKGMLLEEQPRDAKAIKIVLIAGSNFYKAGEHEYIGACAVLADLLKQTPNVFPVLALDWPKKPETLANAQAVVFLFDGGDKHPLLKEDHLAQVQKLADAKVGFVQFHQTIDVPKDLGDRMRSWTGAAWEKGFSQRGHWIGEFKTFPEHPVTRGVKPFKINDGWLYKLRFAADKKGVTPLLRTAAPKAAANAEASDEAIVGWAFDRANGGRSFTFTGTHLHESFAEEGYRRFLVNGILWSAGVDVPTGGAPVNLDAADLPKYLEGRVTPKAK